MAVVRSSMYSAIVGPQCMAPVRGRGHVRCDDHAGHGGPGTPPARCRALLLLVLGRHRTARRDWRAREPRGRTPGPGAHWLTLERFVSSPMVFLMDDEHRRCLGTPRRRERPCSATALALVLRQGTGR